METETPLPAAPTNARRQAIIRVGLIGFALAALNIGMYFLLPPDLLERLGAFGYLGAFASAALANASVIVPVPYYPLLIRLGQAFNPTGIFLAAALGSAIGELVAYYIGRSGRAVVEETRFYRWIQRQLMHRWRAPLVLFALSAPPNPFFDVAGLLAGALGIPVWIFFSATLAGRVVRMALVVWFGIWIS
jgi:membrane protein YqaA with SNARE-associated domain